ncbi:hypothetical protein ACIQXA_24425 [Streptomyces massasporeus]|uniref:hypothetical protein n=1 Tax=Streptomyces massasporeus TaxID=67324 RepID=UPI00380A01E9
MMDLVCVLLLPIFFAFSGLNTELGGIAEWPLIGPFLLILAAGFVGKYAGSVGSCDHSRLVWVLSWANGGVTLSPAASVLTVIPCCSRSIWCGCGATARVGQRQADDHSYQSPGSGPRLVVGTTPGTVLPLSRSPRMCR